MKTDFGQTWSSNQLPNIETYERSIGTADRKMGLKKYNDTPPTDAAVAERKCVLVTQCHKLVEEGVTVFPSRI